MKIRFNTMPPEELFIRILFGFIMIGSTFIEWGKWITFMLGIIFLIFSTQSYCISCAFKKFFKLGDFK